ncbi:DUF3500 domain-containing protein [Parathalassolituus penaei]|uniref:DUF3500 domain-containing protein n=1 Tax=Parathalassolituus penaei TaxID=2997323 RepID=A0A9X3ISI5_9GAMM|nr:DUF3500 domain-containing protein [Parathalassolituus penaei]MCY0965871.1 DUF3500 domain-containing protein [Parathalassolituus penaei]
MNIRALAASSVITLATLPWLSGCQVTLGDATTEESSSSSSDILTASVSLGDCDLDTQAESVACAANAFLDTLSSSELSKAQLSWSDSEARTVWSNLPVGTVTRNGLRLDAMSDESKTAALVLARAALSDAGYVDMIGGFAADEYLNSVKGASGYGAELYYVAIFGDPSADGDWMLQIGGHHMAYNITWLSGQGYPFPHHKGAEPKASFTLDSATYAPLKDEADALVAVFDSLDSTDLSYAYLSGESYSDVLVGPDNGSGTLPDNYPSGSDRDGMLVSDMSTYQQSLVKEAIRQWVEDYPDDIADDLMDAYTSDEAFADTYVAWAGTQSKGVDVDTSGTYMRIDGPRLWIEIACQGGIVITNETHYHTMFRDKYYDYGNSL